MGKKQVQNVSKKPTFSGLREGRGTNEPEKSKLPKTTFIAHMSNFNLLVQFGDEVVEKKPGLKPQRGQLFILTFSLH